jgi:hypothetical protein
MQAKKRMKVEGHVTPPPARPTSIVKVEPEYDSPMISKLKISSKSNSPSSIASLHKDMSAYATKLESDETAFFYYEQVTFAHYTYLNKFSLFTFTNVQVKEIMVQHSGSYECIGLSTADILDFISKKHLQLPPLSEIELIFQKMMDDCDVFENIKGHFKINL